MCIENKDTAAKRVVRKNEKFNVPDQTEKEEAETHESAPVENLADDEEIKRRKANLASSTLLKKGLVHSEYKIHKANFISKIV